MPVGDQSGSLRGDQRNWSAVVLCVRLDVSDARDGSQQQGNAVVGGEGTARVSGGAVGGAEWSASGFGQDESAETRSDGGAVVDAFEARWQAGDRGAAVARWRLCIDESTGKVLLERRVLVGPLRRYPCHAPL